MTQTVPDTDTQPLTVYHDAQCPLCRREVAMYQRLDRAGRIAWHDVSRSAGDLARDGVTQQQALARIHARRPDGRLISGAAVFVAMWRRLPWFRWLAPIAGWRPVLWVLERAYVWFARRRQRITGRAARACDDETCATP
jgi:predicted DCC family thiol-disulfide oxidoreductase YuxK